MFGSLFMFIFMFVYVCTFVDDFLILVSIKKSLFFIKFL